MRRIFLFLMVFFLTGCGNSQKLVCTSSDDSEEIKKNSTLEIKVNEDRVVDMKFTVDMIFPDEYRSNINSMAESVRQSKPYMDVYIINSGIRLVTKDDKDNFIGIKMNQKITYGEIKEVLELQGYSCK